MQSPGRSKILFDVLQPNFHLMRLITPLMLLVLSPSISCLMSP
jgi:hypothetical protein